MRIDRCFLYTSLLVFSVATFAQEISASSFSCNAENPVAVRESSYVEIGGIAQWVTIRGDSCSNPIVLFVHGGPGNPTSGIARSLYKKWESEFTFVHWDQRGSGKTFEANQETAELTLENLNQTELTIDLLVSDGLAVTDYVRNYLSAEKLVLTGTSWGSVIAAEMAQRTPQKFYFYVGLSQLVNYSKNMQASYSSVLEQALQRDDQQALDVLHSIGNPPWTNPRSFGQLRRIIRRYEGEVTEALPDVEMEEIYATEQARSAYFAGEEFSFVKFVGLNGDGMAQAIRLDSTAIEFKIPVFLIQGLEDLLTVPTVTKRYFDAISAPLKMYIEVPRAGHDPNIPMLEKQFEMMKLGLSGYENLKNKNQ